jgi:hypothetical protein
MSETFFLRGGYILNADGDYQKELGWLTGLSAGLGVKAKPTQSLKLGLDYSFRYMQYIKPTHRLLLTVGF